MLQHRISETNLHLWKCSFWILYCTTGFINTIFKKKCFDFFLFHYISYFPITETYSGILNKEAFCYSTVIAFHHNSFNIHSWYLQYVSIHSWLIQSGQIYESKTHWNEATVEIQYFYYVVISPRDETGTQRLCYKQRRWALVGRGEH